MDTVLRDNWPWPGSLGLDGYVPTPNDTQAHTPRSQSGPPDWGRTVFSNLAGGGACCQPSGEQVRAALRQLHERSAIVNFQPARANRAFEAGRVFRRRRFVAEQERAVEFLDIDAAFLDRLEGGLEVRVRGRGQQLVLPAPRRRQRAEDRDRDRLGGPADPLIPQDENIPAAPSEGPLFCGPASGVRSIVVSMNPGPKLGLALRALNRVTGLG